MRLLRRLPRDAVAVVTIACQVPSSEGDPIPDDTPTPTEDTDSAPPASDTDGEPIDPACEHAVAPPPMVGADLAVWPFQRQDLPQTEEAMFCTVVADVSGDGRADLILGLAPEGAGPFLRIWTDLSAAPRDIPIEGLPGSCLVVDRDDDGTPEVLVMDDAGILQVEDPLGDATMTWIWKPPTRLGHDIYGMALVDLDGVGPLDLIASLGGEGNVCVSPSVSGGDVILPRDDHGQFIPGRTLCLMDDASGLREVDAPACPAALGAHGTAFPFDITMADLNNDGRPEIFVTGDFWENVLLESGADGWTDISKPSGLGGYNHAMGAAWADVDRDGRRDLFITDYGPSQMAVRGACTTFFDAAAPMGIADATFWTITWGVHALDIEADGDLDFLVTQSMEPGEQRFHEDVCQLGEEGLPGPSTFLLVQRDGRFTRVDSPPAPWTAALDSVIVAAGDLDGDLDVDIVTAQRGRGVTVLWNEAVDRGSRIAVRPLTAQGSPAWGTRVVVEHDGGARLDELWLASGTTAQSEPVLRFGLGAGNEPVTVRVRWPDGSWTIQRDIPRGGELVVRQGDR